MKNFKLENFFKHPISSIIGVMIGVSVGVVLFLLVFLGKTTIEAITPFGVATVPVVITFLLYGNDKKSNEPPKTM